MELLCKVCNRSIIENESEYNIYKATLRHKIDKSLHNKHIINNISLDEVNKTINDYISTHNKKFDFCFNNCEFLIEFDNSFKVNIETSYIYNTDIINKNRYLIFDIDCFISRRHKIHNINQMTINSVTDRCDMTFENYINQPMHMCERKINMKIARNPHLINSLDPNKNHPLIRKYLHRAFNN